MMEQSELIEMLEPLKPDNLQVKGDIIQLYFHEYDDVLNMEHFIVMEINHENTEVSVTTNVVDLTNEVGVSNTLELPKLKEMLKHGRKCLKDDVKKLHNIKKSLIKLVDKLDKEGYGQPEKMLNSMLFDNSLEYLQ